MRDELDYGSLKWRVLEVMSKNGDRAAKAEIERRQKSGAAPKDAGPLLVTLPRRRLQSFEFPRESTRYRWAPYDPQRDPDPRFQQAASDYYTRKQ